MNEGPFSLLAKFLLVGHTIEKQKVVTSTHFGFWPKSFVQLHESFLKTLVAPHN